MDLSIIVPVYNVSEYLEECLESIYDLTLEKYEVILVNDGSTDNSLEIIEEWKVKFPEKTIIINQENKGLSGARNAGLKIASGRYVAFIDSDDIIESKNFEVLFNLILQNDLDVGLGEYNRLIDNDLFITSAIKKRVANKKLQMIQSGKSIMNELLEPLKNHIRVEAWANIYKREFLLMNNLFFVEKLLHEDTLFFFRVFHLAEKTRYYPIVFYYYRQRSGSIMSATNNLISNLNKLYIIDSLLSDIESENKSNKALNSCLLSIYFNLVFRHKVKNIEISKKLLSLRPVTLAAIVRKILILLFHNRAIESTKKIGK